MQQLLEQLAELTAEQVTELLQPYKDLLLAPIFQAKSLRSLSLPMQIGQLDALTFCLGLRPPLLTFTPLLLNMLQEALAIAESEEGPGGKPAASAPGTPTLFHHV